MKTVFAVLALCVCAFAQNDRTQQVFYTNGLTQYICFAPSNVAATSVKVSDSSLTNVVVSSNVATVTTASAHNLWIGARVVISGSSTSALNGTYTVATTPSSTTYTLTTSGVADATYTTGIVITTNSPLLSSPTWFVSVFVYDSNSNLIGTYPGGGALSLNYTAKCSDRAKY